MCTISVIIPVYNVEKTVGKCLQSVLSQTFSDIEVIVVNDGTKDNSMEVVKRYAIDKRVKIINKENAGLPQARKTGFLEAQGECVFFVDSDDWIEENTLELLYKAMESTDADISCCNFVTEYAGLASCEKRKVKRQGVLSQSEAVSEIHNMSAVFESVWNKLYRKSVISQNDFPTGNFIGEDYCTVVSIMLRANKVVQIEDALYHYMQYGWSMTKAGFNTMHAEAYWWYKKARVKVLEKYPEKKREIVCFHLLQEMGLLNAMFRSDTYNKEIKADLLADVKANSKTVLLNRHTRLIYKGGVFVVAMNWKLYRNVYRLIYKRMQSRYL